MQILGLIVLAICFSFAGTAVGESIGDWVARLLVHASWITLGGLILLWGGLGLTTIVLIFGAVFVTVQLLTWRDDRQQEIRRMRKP